MADEQFHEFHLDGKQMVFLFMASTVVAVVIFLCGVMVGRGVRASKAADVVAAAADLSDPTAAGQPADGASLPATAAAAAPGATDDPTRPAPEEKAPVVPEGPSKDAGRGSVRESLPDPPAAAPKAAAKDTTPRKDTTPQAPEPARDPAKSGFTVQVMTAVRQSDADAEVKKLRAKGYRAFVLPIADGKQGFRVRVGPYKTRKEAEAGRARLEKVEHYKKAWLPPR